jgi:adenylosuccinate lyase
MPHKRNPNRTERICGLSRVIRGSVVSSLETIALEHERDISNSSIERINIPEGFILTDYILRQTTSIMQGLVFDHENIRRNLDLTLGLCLTERVMLELVKKGMSRQRAHEMLRRLAMECWEEKRSLREVMQEDEEARGLATEAELDDWLRPENYIGTAVQQVERVVQMLRERFPQRK